MGATEKVEREDTRGQEGVRKGERKRAGGAEQSAARSARGRHTDTSWPEIRPSRKHEECERHGPSHIHQGDNYTATLLRLELVNRLHQQTENKNCL